MRQGRESRCARGSKGAKGTWGVTCRASRHVCVGGVSSGCGEDGANRAGPWRRGPSAWREMV
jgi:hypothetical protein